MNTFLPKIGTTVGPTPGKVLWIQGTNGLQKQDLYPYVLKQFEVHLFKEVGPENRFGLIAINRVMTDLEPIYIEAKDSRECLKQLNDKATKSELVQHKKNEKLNRWILTWIYKMPTAHLHEVIK